MLQNDFQTKFLTLISGGLVSSVLLSSMFLTTSLVSADDSAVDTININVPVSCNITSTGNDSHTATIENGRNVTDIGTTTIKVFCNDNSGFAIYAAGYTGEEIEGTNSNKLVSSDSALSSNSIVTGTNTSGNTSNWSMKLTKVENEQGEDPVAYNPANLSILSDTEGSFSSYHTVPNEYTKVATFSSSTDVTLGSVLRTTYQVYISPTQPASSYAGKVIYTLVHPASTPTPKSTMLDTGQVVGAKMKTLAAGGTTTAYNTKTSDIKAIRMADSLPNDFVPSEANTVSAATSRHPIYIFFDNTDDAGIMYFYTGGYQVVMNPDSSHLFRSNLALADISGLADWDASNVATMYAIFLDSTIELTNVDALARWDTLKVEDMRALFSTNGSTTSAGYRSKLTDISGLMNWDVSNVTNMQTMFQNASSLTSLHGLEFWDVSKVENMRFTFACGDSCSTIISDISALSNWDTRSVTNTESMFQNASQLTSLHGLEFWDVSKVENMSFMFAMGPGRSRTGDPVIDLSPLAKWNVSNVTNMQSMFQNNNIASFLPLSKWDVGKVQDFTSAFNQTSASTTTTLAGLENWNVSSATNMSEMFADSVSLTDASAINGWDVRNVIIGTGAESVDEGFNNMFKNSPVHPTFTLRAGTWNNNGTFIPSS